jgi:hypothetical protein
MSCQTPTRDVVSPQCVSATGDTLQPTLDLDFSLGTLPPGLTMTRGGSAGCFDASGNWVVLGANLPRFDYNPVTLGCRGILLEESRTNSMRNAVMAGATNGVIGSGGALPTNCVLESQGTLVAQVMGSGVASGLEYVDIRLSGTTSTTSCSLRLETTTGIGAAASQRWCGSVFAQRVGGSMANISQTRLVLVRDGAVVLATGSDFSAALSSGSRLERQELQAVTTAGTMNIWHRVQFNFSSGVVIDVTLRVAGPQLERGDCATSLIKSSGAATTRAGDTLSMTGLSGILKASEGTLLVEGNTLATVVQSNFAGLSDGSNANRIYVRALTSLQMNVEAFGGGVSQSSLTLGNWVSRTYERVAAAWRLNDYGAMQDGITSATSATGAVPVGLSQLELGRSGTSGTELLNGWLRRVSYYPNRLGRELLQAVSLPL